MTVLVTGGAGYIGSHMVWELTDRGEKVVVLDNLSTGFRWAIPETFDLVVGDFGDEALVSDLLARHEVESIIHFAAKIVVPESVSDPLGYYLNNTAKARALLDVPPPPPPQPSATPEADAKTVDACPCCGGRMLLIEIFERGSSPRTAPTPPGFRIDSS